MSKAVDMTVSEYAKQTKDALTDSLKHDTTYIYQVTIQEQTLHVSQLKKNICGYLANFHKSKYGNSSAKKNKISILTHGIV